MIYLTFKTPFARGSVHIRSTLENLECKLLEICYDLGLNISMYVCIGKLGYHGFSNAI